MGGPFDRVDPTDILQIIGFIGPENHPYPVALGFGR